MNGPNRLLRNGAVEADAGGALTIVFEPGGRAGEGGACAGGVCPACAGPGGGRLRLAAVSRCFGDSAPGAGDRVEVSIASAGLSRVAGATFGVPLAGLLAGAAAGGAIGGEPASILLGGLGLAAGFAWLRGKGAGLVGLLELRARAVRSASVHPIATGNDRRVKTRSEV